MFKEGRSKQGKKNTRRMVPKLIGCDSEMGNFFSGADVRSGTGKEASRAIIREVTGYPDSPRSHLLSCTCRDCDAHWRTRKQVATYRYASWYGPDSYAPAYDGNSTSRIVDPQDHDRRYLAENGGCIYIDLNHVELCVPETRSAYDYVACWHASLRILRRSLEAAAAKIPEGQELNVLVNNSDGQGHAYGSHMNFLVTRRCWREIFERRIQYLLYLAAFQTSSVLYTGQGKVGSENGAPHVDYQLTQRGDFFEQLVGQHTTYCRPIVNSRDEPLCGGRMHGVEHPDQPEAHMARLHSIFFDNTLCHVATLLKAGVMQIILASIEAGDVDLRLILEDPVAALKAWGHDPSLRATARMCSGRKTTAIDLQKRFLDRAARFVNRGRCDGIVPRAGEIIELWADTLDKLERRDFDTLSRRLDWVLKYMILNGVLDENRELDWNHVAMKHLDHLYSSLNSRDGLYWIHEQSGDVERVVSEADVERFECNPPDDTRAFTRAMLLRHAAPGRLSDVDWDQITVIVGDDELSQVHRTVDLANPLAFDRAFFDDALARASSAGTAPMDAVLDAIEGRRHAPGEGNPSKGEEVKHGHARENKPGH